MTPNDEERLDRIQRLLSQAKDSLRDAKLYSEEAGADVGDLVREWEIRLEEQWSHQ